MGRTEAEEVSEGSRGSVNAKVALLIKVRLSRAAGHYVVRPDCIARRIRAIAIIEETLITGHPTPAMIRTMVGSHEIPPISKSL